MPVTQSSDELASWVESRKLIITQLSQMEGSIRDLSVKIDKFNDLARDRMTDAVKENQASISDLRVRIALVEVQAKVWGARLGLIAGALATGVVQLVVHYTTKAP